MNNKQNGLQDAVINALTTLQEKRYWIKTDLLTQYLNTETKVNITSQVVTEITVTQTLREIYKQPEFILEYKHIADFTWFHIRTNQQQPAAAPPPTAEPDTKAEPVETENYRLPKELQSILPQNHQTTAYYKAKVLRLFRNNVYDINKIQEITRIPPDTLLKIYVEIQPEQ